MPLAVNAYCFPHEDIEDNAAAAAAAGFDGLEPILDIETREDPAAIDEIRTAAADHDLAIPSVAGGGGWDALSSTDEETRQKGVEQTEQLVEAAATLGAETVLVVPGGVTSDRRYDRAYDRALESVREVAATAATHDVTIGVENVWNGLLYSPREFREFVDAAAEAGPVAAYFDAGNVARFGYPAHWIEILGDRIQAVHVKDYDEAVDTIDGFTYPLAGSIDWPEVTDALAGIDYDGWITPEIPPYEAVPDRTLPNLQADLAAIFE